MQRIVDYGLEVNEYEDVTRQGLGLLAVPAASCACPFCLDGHPMDRHGAYERCVDDGERARDIRALRYLCRVKGRTVSLLPSFLMPRKQATCKVIETYFTKRHMEGLPQAAAIAAATKTNPSRQKGAYWDQCLAKKASVLMAHLHPRRAEDGALLPRLVRHMLHGFASPGKALSLHNQRLRARFSVWLL